MGTRKKGKTRLPTKKRRGVEFSKLIVVISLLLFILTLLDLRGLVKQGVDVSSYATQLIVTVGGILGASIVFYLNKSKIENLSKGKIRFTLLRLRLEIKLKGLLDEEQYQLIFNEIDEVEHLLEAKLDGALEDAIQKEIEIN